MPRLPATEQAERVRRLLAPLIAFLSASLALCCLATVPDIVVGWSTLVELDGSVAGWFGLAVIVAVTVAAVALAGSTRLGSGPPLRLGAAAALAGLALSQDITSEAQVVLAQLTLAVAVGALFASGLCMVDELPPRWSRATFIGWVLPITAGWGVLAWVTLHARSRSRIDLGVHPPTWAIVVSATAILFWAVLILLLEPPRAPNPTGVGWENAWAALGALVIGIGSIVMLVGFQPDLSGSWVRPVVLLTTAVAVGGLALCGWLIPLSDVRPAYVAVVVVLLCGPSCLQIVLLHSSSSGGSLSWWLLVVLAVAGLAGGALGWRHASSSTSAGLLVMALSTAGAWVMPSNEWIMCAAAAPMAAGVSAACTGGLRLATTSRMGIRYVSMSALTAVVFGLLAAGPLAWSLGAQLTGGSQDVQAGGRVVLGLTFALTVLASAGVSVLLRRASYVDVADAAMAGRATQPSR